MDEISQFIADVANKTYFVRESREPEIRDPVLMKPFASFESCETSVNFLKSAVAPNSEIIQEFVVSDDDLYPEEEEIHE